VFLFRTWLKLGGKIPIFPTGSEFLPFLKPLLENNKPHIRIPAAFPWPGWDKLNGKNSPGLKAIGGHQVRCISVVFC